MNEKEDPEGDNTRSDIDEDEGHEEDDDEPPLLIPVAAEVDLRGGAVGRIASGKDLVRPQAPMINPSLSIPVVEAAKSLEVSKGLTAEIATTAELASFNTKRNEEGAGSDDGQLPILPPCPVTVLTGFLGSGKTTLINYILKSPDHGKRIAVIENEYGSSAGDGAGALSIESLLVRDGLADSNQSSSLADLIELPNGCVCCTVKDSLVQTLEDLVTKKRRDLDHIVVELSGMANPGPVASTFWLDEGLESRLRLDGIVCMVDAKNLMRQLREAPHEAGPQIAYADRVVLNKVDLLDDGNHDNYPDADSPTPVIKSQKQVVLDAIRRLNPTAPCRETRFSHMADLAWILEANCYDADRIHHCLQLTISTELPNAPTGFDHSDHEHDEHGNCLLNSAEVTAGVAASPDHSHTAGISTLTLVRQGSVDLKRLNRWLADILWQNQDEQDAVLRSRLEAQEAAGKQQSSETPHPSTRQPNFVNTLPQVFRIKGFVSVAYQVADRGDDKDDRDEAHYSEHHVDPATGLDCRKYTVQAVHDLWTVQPSSSAFFENSQDSPHDDEVIEEPWFSRRCLLVVIGQRLDRVGLEEGFRSCFVPPRPNLIWKQDAWSLSNLLQSGKVTAVQVMEATLQRVTALNPIYNAIVMLQDPQELLEIAQRLDQSRSSQGGLKRGRLHGIPIAVKDLSHAAGYPTTYGGLLEPDGRGRFVPEASDPYILRLQEAGAVVIGKTNTPQLGLGSHTFNPRFGITSNARHVELSAGGSSGGAAVAVATGMIPVADGTDMMGSLRNPAGWNGVYSFRPTAGLIPTTSVSATCRNSLPFPISTPGALARSVRDLSMLLEIMISDGTVYRCPFRGNTRNADKCSLSFCIGWLGDWRGAFPFEDGILEVCASSLQDCLKDTPHSFAYVHRPLFPSEKLWKAWVTIRSVVVTENVLALLQQQTGLDDDTIKRFVTQHINDENDDSILPNHQPSCALLTHFKKLSSHVKWEMQRGIHMRDEVLVEANHIASSWSRTLDLDVFSTFDVLALPSSQMWPFPKDVTWPLTIQGRKMTTYHEWMQVMVPASLAGLPVVTIPIEAIAPRVETRGRTIGIQLIGKRHSDNKLLQFAYDITQRSKANRIAQGQDGIDPL